MGTATSTTVGTASTARTGTQPGTRDRLSKTGGILQGLRQRLRPGAMSVMTGPGYTYTSIDPLPASAMHAATKPMASATRLPTNARDERAWLQQRMQSLTHKLHEAPGLPASKEPDAARAIVDEAAFANAVAALFPGPAAMETDPHVDRLTTVLIAASHARPTEAAHIPFAGVLQCARALAAATGGHAADAVAALAYLRHGFELTGSGGAHMDPTATSDDAERNAWRAAKLLSHTTVGFDALVALHEDPTLHDPGENSAMKRESLRTFLQAADHVATAAAVTRVLSATSATTPAGPTNTMGTTGAISTANPDDAHFDTPGAQWRDALGQVGGTQHPATAPNALALNAMLCAAKIYAAPHASARQIGDATQVAAYVAWRSGYRESGRGSLLARTQARLSKFTPWIQRAEARATSRFTVFDPRRLFGLRKSPLSAMAYTAGGANLRLVGREVHVLQHAMHASLDALSTHFDALLQRGGLSPEQRGVLLIRQQCVARWKAVLPKLPKAGTLKLSKLDRDTIATILSMTAPRAGLDKQTVLGYRAFTQMKTLNLHTLARWADEADLLGTRPDGADDPRTHIGVARDIEHGRPLKPTDATASAIRATLKQVIADTPLGNNVRYFDGGTYGVNVNTSLNLRDFPGHKAAFGISPGPAVKALHGRHAFVEIGSSSYGGEVFMGTDTRTSTGAGLSVFAGMAVGHRSAKFTLGGGLGAVYSNDHSAPSGVILRTRLQRDENNQVTDSWRTRANEIVDFLFEQSAQSHSVGKLSPERLWQRFSERFFRAQDISVNWRDQRRSSHTVSGTAGLMARITLGGMHIGPALTASHDNLLVGKNKRIDRNGWLRGTERVRTKSSSITGTATLVAAAPSPGHFSTRTAHPESVSIPSVPVIGFSGTFVPKGASMILRMVNEHGRLNARYIRSLVEFVDPASFVAHVEKRRPDIARGASSNARLNAFIHEVKACATRGNQAFGESLKIRPEIADELTAYEADIDTLRRCSGSTPGAAEQIALLSAKIEQRLNEPASWKVSGYYTYEINTRGYMVGPALGLQATAVTTTAGERVLAELAVSELEALDNSSGASAQPTGGGH